MYEYILMLSSPVIIGLDTQSPTHAQLELRLPFLQNANFQGRREELRNLKGINKSNGNIVVIYGLGGMGKTELVVEFVFHVHKAFTVVFWVHADTPEAMDVDFKAIVKHLVNLEASKWTSSQPRLRR